MGMPNYTREDFRPFRERFDQLPAERRAKIEAGAAAIIESLRLAELRKAMSTTQTSLAEKTGMKQADISRIENNPAAAQLLTIERYVRGLGGEVKLVAEFPEGTRAEIPLRAGKPVKSRIRMSSTRKPPEAAE
jgi:DNA-binding XRE family transcriptional regulator